MGYTTYFDGSLTITPKPTKEFTDYINSFNQTRHMKRDNKIIMTERRGVSSHG